MLFQTVPSLGGISNGAFQTTTVVRWNAEQTHGLQESGVGGPDERHRQGRTDESRGQGTCAPQSVVPHTE